MREPKTEQLRTCRCGSSCKCIMTCTTGKITCDGCGKEICTGNTDAYGHELEIAMDPNECVSFWRKRDFCDACILPIWDGINKLLGTNPEDERDRDYG